MEKNKLIINLKSLDFLSLEEKKRFHLIFSKWIGIVSAVLKRNELKEFGLYMYQALTTNSKILFDLNREPSSGGLGVSESKRGAFLSCIGESVERYCMSFNDKKEIIKAKKKEIEDEKTIMDYRLYSDNHYDKNNLINPDNDEIDWVSVNSLFSKEKKLVPACTIYIPYDQNLVVETTSTGIATHKTIPKAIINGLLEIIERDALMINFLKKLRPPKIDLKTLPKELKLFISKIKKRYKIEIYKLYSDVRVPIFLSFIWTKEKGNFHFGIGASAELNSKKAIKKSLKECLFTYFYSKNIMDLRKKNKKKIKSLHEHFLYYQGKNFKKLLAFGGKTISFRNQVIKDRNLLREMKDLGHNVYYKNITTSDVKKSGYKVIKVIVPNFIDLNKSYTLRREKEKRFHQVPKKLGIKSNKNLIKEPHPFP